MKVTIENGTKPEFSDLFKLRVVDIYFQAFGQKITSLIKQESKAREIIKKSINYDMAFYALDKNKNLLGFLGFQTTEIGFIEFEFSYFKEIFKPIPAFLKWMILRVFRPRVRVNEIRIDSIAVDASQRGNNIGTLLIERFFSFAKLNDFERTYLEVVDTNPRAKKLYERLGFKTKKTVNFYFFTRSAGFSAEDIMYKTLI